MQGQDQNQPFIFPKWANYALPVIVVTVLGAGLYLPTVVTFGFSPKTTDVGYQPIQPVGFSHAMHAGQLGMDCRYCHSTVEKAAFAAIPPTQTCMNCHTNVQKPNIEGRPSPNLTPVYESWASGRPIPWVKVHDLPDYAFFNHAAHVSKGVGCASCHGRVDQMERVFQSKPLSMSWCLDCHRQPERALRPKSEVTNMSYNLTPDEQLRVGNELKKQYGIRDADYMTACSTCHR